MNRLQFLSKFVRSAAPYLAQVFSGITLGSLFLLTFTSLRVALGGATDIVIAGLVTCSLAALGLIAIPSIQRSYARLGAFWMLAIWAILQPKVLPWSLNSISRYSLTQLSSESTLFLATLSIVMLSLFPVVFGSLMIITTSPRQGRYVLAGSALSLFLVPTLLGLAITPAQLSWFVIVAAIVTGGASLLQKADHLDSDAHDADSDSRLASLNQALFAATGGFGFAIAMSVGRNLVLDNVLAEFAMISGLLIGLTLATSKYWNVTSTHRWLLFSVFGAGLILLYPWLTWLSIAETAWISNTALIFMSHSLLLAVICLPVGLLVGPVHNTSNKGSANQLAIQFITFTFGFGLAMQSGLAARPAILVLTTTTLLAAVFTFTLTGRQFPQTRLLRVQFIVLLAAIVSSLFGLGRIDSARTEKLVFSGSVFNAFRNGVEFSQLPWIDDGRLVEESADLEDSWSRWKHRGAQLFLRKDGLITEVQSANSAICPLSAAEVLPTLFPMVAHPATERVLVLGAHATTLQTCQFYPLRSVTVLEESSQFESIRKWVTQDLDTSAPVQFVQTNIPLGVKAAHEQQYDLIVAPQTIPATSDGISRLTKNFIVDVQGLLKEGGIYCQRLPYYDLGPDKVKQLIGNFHSTFAQVLTIESVPGELLVMGTNRQESLISKELIQRLQAPQTRLLLSQVGWDWAVPAIRGSLDQTALDQWLKDELPLFTLNNFSNAFELPTEVARWEAKSQATRNELSKHAMALGGHFEEGDEGLDISQRIEDIRLAQRIIDKHPDNVWGYRAALKKQLLDRPRTKIMQVAHEGLKRRMHPDDKRRMNYIETLNQFVNVDTPSLEMVDELMEYLDPFDPLLGPFVCHEAIQQLKRIDQPTEAAQLNTLLYTIYYSTPGDKSVRNVCDAINLLCEHSTIVTSESDRWDDLNGLIEILRHRWQLRIYDKERAQQYETIDTERSLAALKNALEAMSSSLVHVELSEDDWQAREEFIETSLLKPLKQHRSQQLRRTPTNPVTR